MNVLIFTSSHWYLAIICYPYLVSVKQATSLTDVNTSNHDSKQVVTYCC